MTDDTEALLVANACMLHALIARLIEKDILSPEEVGATMVDAEAYLAGLPPALMTPAARQIGGLGAVEDFVGRNGS